MQFTKEGNCFTHISEAAGLVRVADTLSAALAIGRLTRVCERWIYTCLSLALDCEEQTASGLRYQSSLYPLEYSRHLLFQVVSRQIGVDHVGVASPKKSSLVR